MFCYSLVFYTYILVFEFDHCHCLSISFLLNVPCCVMSLEVDFYFDCTDTSGWLTLVLYIYVIQTGPAGSLWYCIGVVMQILLFPMLSIHLKTRAPGAKTFLQVRELLLRSPYLRQYICSIIAKTSWSILKCLWSYIVDQNINIKTRAPRAKTLLQVRLLVLSRVSGWVTVDNPWRE
jgi:hypothetical protein